MLKGGNAVDAAIAAAATLTITEPVNNGIGSDAFCILWDGQRLQGLNASGPAPASWTPAYFERKYGRQNAPPKRGWDSVTVPGAVASWVALSDRYGKLPFADLMEPAIDIAERGFLVPFVVQQKFFDASEHFRESLRIESDPLSASFSCQIFLPEAFHQILYSLYRLFPQSLVCEALSS